MSTPSSPAPLDLYNNPELWRWAGGMEGIPEWMGPSETFDERTTRAPWQARGNELFALLGALLPGLAIALGLAVIGRAGSSWVGLEWFGVDRSPVSPILLAILFGLVVRNTVGLPSVYEAGVQICLKRLLRVGVALLGIRLSLAAMGSIGLSALPIVIGCIASALLFVNWISRAVGLPPRLGTLIAVGTAICGNTAIVATAPVIGADEDETSYAVGTITVFGLIALVTYPFVAHSIFGGNPDLAGFFLGTAIHDTAQVAGAGLLYAQQYAAPETLDTATVTKLVRNLFMVAVIPLMTILYHKSGSEQKAAQKPKLSQMIPLFVFGFVAMAMLRTVGDLGDAPFAGLLSDAQWKSSIAFTTKVSSWCLTMAMASVGLGTNLKRLRSLGLKPLAAGLAAALIVGAVAAGLIHLLASSLTVTT
jgi:uncharacterized integral membrane protein (TIGR00698 family)